METDEHGLVPMPNTHPEEIVTQLDHELFKIGAELWHEATQAQHKADVEIVEGLENPIQGRVYGEDRVRQDAWDSCQDTILAALKAP